MPLAAPVAAAYSTRAALALAASAQVQATAGEEGLKFLLICGQPIGEPIKQREENAMLQPASVLA